MKILIGTSGWWYEHWQGKFYPPDIEKSGWFSHYAKVFDTVEVNSSFYHLPFAGVVKGWARKAPRGFSRKKIKRVYVYFNNDYNAYAVANALKLKELLA